MDNHELSAILQARINNSIGSRPAGQSDKISQDRQKALRYYNGDHIGNEVKGRSQVVSRDVQEAVDSIMPDLMRAFASGEEVVKFEPVGEGDEEAAEQQTDYINYLFSHRNAGFRTLYEWFKAALLYRLAFVKVWWDDQEETLIQRYSGLSGDEVLALSQQEGAEIVETVVDGRGYSAVVKHKDTKGRIRIAPVAEDEMLWEPRATDIDTIGFIAHRGRYTVSDLIEMGYPRNVVKNIPSDDDGEYERERLERFKEESSYIGESGESEMDESMREIWVTEAYLRVDYDGDGVAELRKVVRAGEEILENEEVDEHPFASLCPIPMPHKLIGRSIFDLTEDIQLIKSTLWRQALDHMYQANAPMVGVVEGRVNLDDLLTRRPGGVVRADSRDAVFDLPNPGLSTDPMGFINYLDDVAEKRTGSALVNQGLEKDTLNKTATGINLLQNAGRQRVELIARVFAETGVKRVFTLLNKLTIKHQNKPEVIRLRGKWVTIDPAEWRANRDMTVTVGLGAGNREQQVQTMTALLDVQRTIIEMQGGPDGPLVMLPNVHNALEKFVEAVGFRSAEPFFTDPETVPPKEPPGPSDTDKMLMLEGEKVRADVESKAMDREQKEAEAQRKHELEMERLALEKFKAETQAELKKLEIEAKLTIEEAKLDAAAIPDDEEPDTDTEDVVLVVEEAPEGPVYAPEEAVMAPDVEPPLGP